MFLTFPQIPCPGANAIAESCRPGLGSRPAQELTALMTQLVHSIWRLELPGTKVLKLRYAFLEVNCLKEPFAV